MRYFFNASGRSTRPLPTLTLALAVSLLMLACGANSDLVANAGADNRVTVGAAPQFNACGSTGEITNYAWEIVDAPAANQHDLDKMIRATDATCSFTLEADMQVDEVGEWIIELTVTDNDGDTATDRVMVTVVR